MVKVTIDGTLPSTNEIVSANRQGWRAGARKKKNYTEWCKAFFLQALHKGASPIDYKVDLYVTWYEPSNRRDHDNVLGGGLKHLLDGAIEAGFIPDDNYKYIGDIHSKKLVDKENPRIEVEFRRSEDGNRQKILLD